MDLRRIRRALRRTTFQELTERLISKGVGLLYQMGLGRLFRSGGVLIISPDHGMCNRLYALASAHAVGVLTGRKVLIDWKVDPDHFLFRFEDLFVNPLPILRNPKPERDSDIFYYSWKGTGDSSYLGTILWNRSPVIYASAKSKFGEDAGRRWKEPFLTYLKHLAPIKDVSEAVADYEHRHFESSAIIVGVVYRGWKSRADRFWTLQAVPFEVFFDEMRRQLSRSTSKVLFFIVSDEPSFISEARKALGEDCIISRAKPVDRESLDGQKSGLIDWCLLCRTTYVIGTHGSTYAESAGLLSRTGKSIALGEYPWNE